MTDCLQFPWPAVNPICSPLIFFQGQVQENNKIQFRWCYLSQSDWNEFQPHLFLCIQGVYIYFYFNLSLDIYVSPNRASKMFILVCFIYSDIQYVLGNNLTLNYSLQTPGLNNQKYMGRCFQQIGGLSVNVMEVHGSFPSEVVRD